MSKPLRLLPHYSRKTIATHHKAQAILLENRMFIIGLIKIHGESLIGMKTQLDSGGQTKKFAATEFVAALDDMHPQVQVFVGYTHTGDFMEARIKICINENGIASYHEAHMNLFEMEEGKVKRVSNQRAEADVMSLEEIYEKAEAALQIKKQFEDACEGLPYYVVAEEIYVG